MTVLPFISQLPKPEQLEWVSALNQLFIERRLDIQVCLAEQIPDEIVDKVSVAIVANPDVTQVKRFRRLIWLQSLWAGVEGLVAEFANQPIKVARLIDPNLAQTMSEAALAWSLYAMRDMATYNQQQAQEVWRQLPVKLASDTTVAVLGLGELGQKAAQQLAMNNFKVIGWSNSPKTIAGVDCFAGKETFKSVLASADILVCLLPLTPATKGLFDSEAFTAMKSEATFINFGRGCLVNDDDLLHALNVGELNHAILDVFSKEPLCEGHPFWQHPNVTVLPHISAPTNKKSACTIVVNNIANYCDTGTLPDVVDNHRGY